MKRLLITICLLLCSSGVWAGSGIYGDSALDDNMMWKSSMTTNYGTSVYMRCMGIHGDTADIPWFGDTLLYDTLAKLGATSSDSAKYHFYLQGKLYLTANETLYVYLAGVVGGRRSVETQQTWTIYRTGSAWTTPGGDTTGCISDTIKVTTSTAAGWNTFTIKNEAWLDSTLTATGCTGAVILGWLGGTTDYKGYIDIWSEQYVTDATLQPWLDVYYTTAGGGSGGTGTRVVVRK